MKQFIIDKKNDLVSWFTVKYETICRMVFWGWNLRNSYDFDACTIYDILYLKLDKVYKCMRDDSHLMWNSDTNHKDMKRLLEASKLAKKLSEYDYIRHYHKVKTQYSGKRRTDLLSSIERSLYPNAKPIDNKLYNSMIKKSCKLDGAEKKRDKDRLFRLLNIKIDEWWD